MKWLTALVLSVCSILVHAAPVVTQNGTAVEWVSESDSFRPGQTHWLGLSITPAPGWHTYWRNPGASGAPATLSVNPNPAVVIGGLRWPAPERKVFGGLNVYGYESEVLLAMPAVLTRNESVTLTATANWLVCAELCIPESAELQITLRPGDGQPSDWAQRFGQARSGWPAQDPLPGQWDSTGQAAVDLPPGMDVGTWAFFPYDNQRWPAERYQEVRPFNGRVVFDAPPSEQWPNGELVNLQARQSWRVEFSAAKVSSATPLAWMLLGAFLGGLILNLMPCVFPVLSIKAMGMMHLSGAEQSLRRRRGLVFALGVLASFVAMGGVLLALKSSGAAIGWGFQLQSPVFVLLMSMLMLVLSASMLGWFKFGGAFMGMGQGLTQRGGDQGEFFSGVLAVVVASPCTAPFMGPALGFALASPAWVLFAILLALGVGFALPMWLIHQSDRLAARLPRPGRWMETLQHALAFPMLGTSAWLVWIGGRQLGFQWELAIFLVPIIAGFVVWCLVRLQRRLAVVVSAVVVFCAALWYWPSDKPGVPWAPFSQDALASALQNDQVVLVNVTADWCISCLSNERLVFQSGAFSGMDVQWLKADWTDYDAGITAYLDSFGRAGVPLYVVYRQGQQQVLPQILTTDLVMDALIDR